ncbi:peptidoglycan-binding protein [Patescibacteria group bacterium]|nr:peptidoglycan-binding protein [Patescibacteria group bacterium]
MTSITKKISSQAAVLGLMAVLLLGNAGVANAQGATTFTRDLTVNSSGADVTALQTWLIGKGFSIPAGATGFFGPQTKAALAVYQAANGISPAAGYFGPLTRTKVNGDVTVPTTPTTPNDGGSTSTGDLKGGEATLKSFDLRREDSSGSEGEANVAVMTAEFKVTGGDARVERLDLVVTADNGSLEAKPWKYFDRAIILVDGKEIAKKSVSSKNAWDKISGNTYRLSLSGLKQIIRENNTAKITVAFDIGDGIDADDLDQTFTLKIEDRGIRAVDSVGIQQYIGNTSDSVTFGFDAAKNGDISIRTNSNNPRATILVADESRESGSYEVFIFDLKNKDDVDAIITDLTIDVTGMNSGVTASSVIRNATLKAGRDSFKGRVTSSALVFDDMELEVDGDKTTTVKLVVTLARNATSTPIIFSLSDTNVDAEGVDSGDNAAVSGSVESKAHTIAFAGVDVDAVSAAQAVFTPGGDASSTYGSYTIKFKITGLEEDAYIASTTGSTGTVGVTYEIGGNEYTGTTSAVLSSSARTQNGYYLVRDGSSETFTLTVTLDPETAGAFDVRLVSVRFNDDSSFSGSTLFTVGQNDSGFRTDPIYIAN